MSERRSLPWPGSAGRDGEGPWWDGRMTARSSLLVSFRPLSVTHSSLILSVHTAPFSTFPPSLRPPSHSIRLRHVVESERREHGTEWSEVNETRGQQNQGSKIDRRDGFSVFLPSRPRSAPPHVSFHYVPEPQAEDGNTGGTNREWGVKGVANGTNRACSPPHFPTFLSSVTHVPSSSYRCASGTERSEVEGSERRVTRVRHER